MAHWNEDRVMAEIAAALREPKVPSGVLEAAKGTYTWRTVDAELAALAYDSADAGGACAGVRGSTTAPVRSVSFEAPGIWIELTITDDCILGQILPPRSGVLEAHRMDGTATQVAVDHDGSFQIRPLPAGPFRLRFRTASCCGVLTDYVTL